MALLLVILLLDLYLHCAILYVSLALYYRGCKLSVGLLNNIFIMKEYKVVLTSFIEVESTGDSVDDLATAEASFIKKIQSSHLSDLLPLIDTTLEEE